VDLSDAQIRRIRKALEGHPLGGVFDVETLSVTVKIAIDRREVDLNRLDANLVRMIEHRLAEKAWAVLDACRYSSKPKETP
jgi:allophanate hydrolase subunit 1